MGDRRLVSGREFMADERDWAQLCLFTDGQALEIDLSAPQLSAIALVLGLWRDGEGLGVAVDDAMMEGDVLPLLVREVPALWSRADAG